MKKLLTGTRGGLKKEFIVDDEVYDWLKETNWSCQKIGNRYYAFFSQYVPKYKVKRIYLHALLMDFPENSDVDHVNGNTLDNRVENLRVCSRRNNLLNTGPSARNTSGYKWVTWNKRDQRWRVTVSKKHGGNFTNKKAAVVAANKLARELHGEYAYQNPVP